MITTPWSNLAIFTSLKFVVYIDSMDRGFSRKKKSIPFRNLTLRKELQLPPWQRTNDKWKKQPWMKMYVYLLLKWWCSIVISVFRGVYCKSQTVFDSQCSHHIANPRNYFFHPPIWRGISEVSRPWMQAEGDKGGKDLSTKTSKGTKFAPTSPENPSASKFFWDNGRKKTWEGLCEESTDKVFLLFFESWGKNLPSQKGEGGSLCSTGNLFES